MNERPHIAIVGPGVVGTTLGILAARAGYRVVGIAGRDEARARAAAEAIGPGVRAGKSDQISPAGGLVLLTISDDAIECVCRELASVGAFARGAIVAHCAGAISSDVLAPARECCAAAVGSMHPLQTFPNVAASLEKFPGTYCFCEGDDAAVAALMAFAEAVGGKPVRMPSSGKLLYHAAAVFASNYLAALLDASLTAAEHAGIRRADALAALAPLVRATAHNVMAEGPARALTGPIARGDEELIARQLREVATADADLGKIYKLLGARAVELAVRKGTIDAAVAARLRTLLAPKG